MERPIFIIGPVIDIIIMILLAMAALLQTTLGIALQEQRKTIGSGELGFVIGHQIGKSDAMNGNIITVYIII